MHRRVSRKHLKKQRNFVILSLFVLLLCLSFGYAAFETNINLKAKGNLKQKAISIDALKQAVVTSGDGLYKDSLKDGRYIYRGADPNNYITLDNDTYRIISIEDDGTLKVMKNTILKLIPFDNVDNRHEEGTYCTGVYENKYAGCSVWGSINTVLDKNGNNVTTWPNYYGSSEYYKLPTKEAGINTYLNTTWYNSLSNDVKDVIVSHYFDIGAVSVYNTSSSMSEIYNQESLYKWQGKIALINIYDYMNASPNDNCHASLYNNWQSLCSSLKTCSCAANNYIGVGQKVITPVRQDAAPRTTVITIYFYGSLSTITANSQSPEDHISYKPAFYLSSSIMLKGEGTNNNPYKIAK